MSAARALRAIAVALAVAFVALWLGVALARLGHPFELEWLEGGSLDHVRRVLEGRPLYGPPSLEFTPFMYTPLYYYASAVSAHAFGPTLPALRLVSLLASLATLVLLGDLVRRETGRVSAGLLAAGLYAATFRISGAWFDVARVDALCLALVAASLYALRVGRSAASALASGVLLALAVQTKQVAALAVLPFALAAWPASRRRAWQFTAAFLLAAGATAVACDHASGGWYRYYVFTLTRQHQLIPRELWAFWLRDLVWPLPFALAIVVAAARTAGPHRAALRFHAVAGAGLLAMALISRMNVGGYHNVVMPAHLLAALLFGLAAGGLDGSRWSTALHAACAVQLLMRGYDPRRLVPTAADRAAGERLVADLRARPGPILLPSHPYLLPLAGHPGHAHQMALNDVLLNERHQEIRQLVAAPLREALRERRYRAIVLDPWFWFRAEVERCYRLEAPAFADERVFWPVTGAPTRPEAVYVPGGAGPCDDMPPESASRPPPDAYRDPSAKSSSSP
ncbi:MAG TPA: glycosyltransferase family 39 protein [Vicinamibacteria bacterium]